MDYIPITSLVRGASRGRLRSGARCGARGRGFRKPRPRAASGLRPEPLWVPARSWLTPEGFAFLSAWRRDNPMRGTGAKKRKEEEAPGESAARRRKENAAK
jgi:hypothetical protein